MNTNLQLNPEFEKGSSLSGYHSTQIAFENDWESELSIFAEVFEEAWEGTQQELAEKAKMFNSVEYLTPLSKSQRMNENIKGLIAARYPDLFGEAGKRFFLAKKGQFSYKLFFKKLDKDLRPMNNPTQTSERILNQGILDFSNSQLKDLKVFVGYTLNSSADELQDLWVVYISQKEIIWKIDLRQFMGGIRSLDLFPIAPVDDSPIIVKPKGSSSSNQATEEDDAPLVRPKKHNGGLAKTS